MSPELTGSLTLIVLAAIAIAAIVWDKHRRCETWSLYLLYIVERIYIRLGFGWRANRRCPFPSDSGAIIIANHRSPIDPMMLWMNSHISHPDRRVRTIHFLTAREYIELGGFVGWICRTMQTIPVDRNGRDFGSLKESLRLLRAGELVGIFPEGGIRTGRQLRGGHPGAAWIALSEDVPVFPVWIHNSPMHESMTRPFWLFQRVRLTYGDPIDLSRYRGRKKTSAMLEEVTAIMLRHLERTRDIGEQDEVAEQNTDALACDPHRDAAG